MQRFIVFSCLLAATAGFVVLPNFGGKQSWERNVVSKREADNGTESSATSADVYQLINETLQAAAEGINADNLKDAADSIQVLATAVLQKREANVSQDEIRSLINAIADQYNITLSADTILDDALTAHAKYIAVAFSFLQKLREQGQNREVKVREPLKTRKEDLNAFEKKCLAAGEPTDVHVAAIEEVSEALGRFVSQTVGIVRFLAATNELSSDGGNGNDNDTATRRPLQLAIQEKITRSKVAKDETKRGASPDDNLHRNKRKFVVGLTYGNWGLWGSFGKR